MKLETRTNECSNCLRRTHELFLHRDIWWVRYPDQKQRKCSLTIIPPLQPLSPSYSITHHTSPTTTFTIIPYYPSYLPYNHFYPSTYHIPQLPTSAATLIPPQQSLIPLIPYNNSSSHPTNVQSSPSICHSPPHVKHISLTGGTDMGTVCMMTGVNYDVKIEMDKSDPAAGNILLDSVSTYY